MKGGRTKSERGPDGSRRWTRRGFGVAVAAALLAASCNAGGGEDATPETTVVEGSAVRGGSDTSTSPVRYQDVWIYEQISTVDRDGGIVALSSDLLGHADDLGEVVALADGTTFEEWSALEPVLVDGDGSPREDVDVVAGVLRADEGAAVMVVATPRADDTPPIDHDDRVELDLTVLDDMLEVGDPLIYEYGFAHTWGPDDVSETGVDLLVHRLDEGRMAYAGGPGDEAGVALVTDLGQVHEGSLKGRVHAKAGTVADGRGVGADLCIPETGISCVAAFWADLLDGAVRLDRMIARQLCVDDCLVAGAGGDGSGSGGAGDGGGDGDGGGGDAGDVGDDGDGDGGRGGDDDGDDEGGDGGGETDQPELCRTCIPGLPGGGGDDGEGGFGGEGHSGGSIYGDPHLRTFDGLGYSMQSVGEFVVAESENWMVQARFVPWGSTISIVGMVGAQMGDHVIVLDPSGPDDTADEPRLTVDGEDVTPMPNGPAVEYGDLTLRSVEGVFQAIHPDLGVVELETGGLPGLFVIPFDSERRFVGLLGDADGETGNDLRLGRAGEVVGTDWDVIHGDYADAWRIDGDESLFPYDSGESTETFTDRAFPPESVAGPVADSPDLNRAETLCALAGLEEGAGLEECVVDYALMGDVGWVTAAARAAQALTSWESALSADGPGGEESSSVTAAVLDGLTPGEKVAGITDGASVYQFATDDGTPVLLAIDGTTAQERWRLTGMLTTCRMALVGDDGLVVVGSAGGPLAVDGQPSLTVVDRATGEVRSSVVFEAAPSTYCEPLEVVGDLAIVAGYYGGVHAWDVAGDEPSLAWTTETDGSIPEMAVAGDRIVLNERTEAGSRLLLLDPDDGSTLSSLDLEGGISDHELLADGDLVVALTGASDVEGSTGSITAVEVDGDELRMRWQHDFFAEHDDPDHVARSSPSSPSLTGDRYIAHVGDDDLVAFDTADGSLVWRSPIDAFKNSWQPAIVIGDRVVDTSFGGPALVVYSLADGEVVETWSASDVFPGVDPIGQREVHGPVVNGRLFVEGWTDGVLVVGFVDIDSITGG